MFGFYLSLPFLVFALYRFFIVVYNYFTRPYLPNVAPIENPLVSILIHANGSETTIGELLECVSNQTYQNLEILIGTCKENSSSVSLIHDYCGKDKRAKFIDCPAVTEGWVKNNFVYDLLSQTSKGQYIIFIDSDILLEKEIVANALSYMQLKGLSLLTLFSKQLTDNHLVNLYYSIVNWLLITMCPLKRVAASKRISLSSTSDQFMMFESSSYRSFRWHEKYKGFKDINLVIGRFVKNAKLKVATLLSKGDVCLNSSENDIEAAKSFIFNFFGRNRNRLLVYSFVMLFGPLFVIFLLPFPLVFLYLFSIIFARMLYALINGKSPFIALLTLPIHTFIFIYLVIRLVKTKSGK